MHNFDRIYKQKGKNEYVHQILTTTLYTNIHTITCSPDMLYGTVKAALLRRMTLEGEKETTRSFGTRLREEGVS